ncbi:unnamed protein product, partial [Tenebrio molitor]
GSRLLPHAKPTLFLPEKSDNTPLQGPVTSVQGESIPGLSSNNNNQLLDVSIPDEDLWYIDKIISVHEIFDENALKDRPPTTRRYTEEYKQFALKLYFTSPKAYKLLQKSFILPNIRSLQRITQNMDFKVGFNGFVFKAFQLKLNSLAEAERC